MNLTARKFDLDSVSNTVLLNPRTPKALEDSLRNRLAAVDHLSGHFFLLTSGSTATSEADYKWVALAKSAVIASAEASNRFLGTSPEDVWFHMLPSFHVGGLGIEVRALLAGNEVVCPSDRKWQPARFAEEVKGSTLTSLVPTQVYDLVQLGLKAPESLRAILVGGGAMSPALQSQALELGWPVLATYGLTETASQAATQKGKDQSFTLLDHLEAKNDDEGHIQIRGASVFTGYVTKDGFIDPKDEEGWFTTEDLGTVESRQLSFLGRARDRIKIGGELANLAILREAFDEEAAKAGLKLEAALTALPDERLENVIALAVLGDDPALKTAMENYDRRVLPFERIRVVRTVREIPKTELLKVKWSELAAILSKP